MKNLFKIILCAFGLFVLLVFALGVFPYSTMGFCIFILLLLFGVLCLSINLWRGLNLKVPLKIFIVTLYVCFSLFSIVACLNLNIGYENIMLEADKYYMDKINNEKIDF